MSDPVSEEPDPERLAALEKRLATLRKEEATPKPAATGDFRMAEMGYRMIIDLIAGLGIGFGIGYGLDAILGTKPFLMLVFIFLGFAAGVKVMLRSADEMTKAQAAAQSAGKEGK
ncbi:MULTISPECIES: AtpZ/AtpI family protein [Rhodobacter]|uniref:ATP synthase protein I n=2 Tax=Rhodobacter TaxID=1060 RepID=A0A285RPE8_9RHOB|nr:AtpZ/AtpI family protein [Rhodobacter maris]SOB94292.1 ATP synthase protein I [Rhodobacter maris]